MNMSKLKFGLDETIGLANNKRKFVNNICKLFFP